jgi:hypothetical protein
MRFGLVERNEHSSVKVTLWSGREFVEYLERSMRRKPSFGSLFSRFQT